MKNNILLTSLFSACMGLLISPGIFASSDIIGSLTNFDVTNRTGMETHGFEIEIHGIDSSDVAFTFGANYIRYGNPEIIPLAAGAGVKLRYKSPWNSTTGFSEATPIFDPTVNVNGHSCWSGGLGSNYGSSGCEHFGVSLRKQPSSTKYRWLKGDPATGELTAVGADLALPVPQWSVQQPANQGEPAIVRAEIEIPNPEGGLYGVPYWVKIFKTEIENQVELNNLLLDDQIFNLEQTEIEWEMLQKKPGDANLALNEAVLPEGVEAVIRRYEFYEYNVDWGKTHTFSDNGTATPYVDLINGEVQACVVDGCNNPTADELGQYIGRQIAGVNIQVVPLPQGFLLFSSALGLLVMRRMRC